MKRPDVSSRAATLAPECALYAYVLDEDQFDDLAMALYFASGKFNRWSLQYWSSTPLRDNVPKAQNFRAAVDNTVVFLPTAGESPLDLAGALILVGHRTERGLAVVAIGAIAGEPFEPPGDAVDTYRPFRNCGDLVIPVHVLAVTTGVHDTFEDLCQRAGGFRPSFDFDVRPEEIRHVHRVADDLRDSYRELRYVDVDALCHHLDEISRQCLAAGGLVGLLDAAAAEPSAMPSVHEARTGRIRAVRDHVVGQDGEYPDAVLPAPTTALVSKRRKTQTVAAVMGEHARHAGRYGRMMTSL